MKSIERRYRKIAKKNLLTEPYGILRLTVLGMKYKPRTISTYFDLLVPPEDYNKKERAELLADLNRATNQFMPRTDKNEGKLALKQVENQEMDEVIIQAQDVSN